MIEITPVTLFTAVLFLIAVIGAGAGVPAALMRANAIAYKERAQQTEKKLDEVQTELKDLTRDFRELKSDHEGLKDKYIRVLEESRNDNRTLIADVRHELREIKEFLERKN
jgi:peptidoglycan hydrolase CwlO-like protein